MKMAILKTDFNTKYNCDLPLKGLVFEILENFQINNMYGNKEGT